MKRFRRFNALEPFRRIRTVLVIATLLSAHAFLVAASAVPQQATQRLAIALDTRTVLLADGHLLRVGGFDGEGPQDTVAVFDPSTGQWVSLPTQLAVAREGHSVTVTPTGSVLIIGGRTHSGRAVDLIEVFDPAIEQIQWATFELLEPRAYHSTTVLTDGRLLIVGGIGANGLPLGSAELWDPAAGQAIQPPLALGVPRAHHSARLDEDGRVRLSGGVDDSGTLPRDRDELFHPDRISFSKVDNADSSRSSLFQLETVLEGSVPDDGATGVSVDVGIGLRFSRAADVATVTAASISLHDQQNVVVPVRVVPVEDGRLVFVWPGEHLLPGQEYTVSVQGVVDTSGNPVRAGQVSFVTASKDQAPAADADDIWTPDDSNGWRTGLPPSPWETQPPLMSVPGVTALSGRVLRITGQPLAGVALSIEGSRVVTDDTGRFLLEFIPAGQQELVIDGREVATPKRNFGVYEVGVPVKPGETNILPYTIWLTPIDTAHNVRIESPTVVDTAITTPRIQGLEVRIPAGTIIADRDGTVVRQVSITPIPLDRPPFPLPNVRVPVYITIQPGGAYLYSASGEKITGARLYYPNREKLTPGTRFDFWNYDPDDRGWFIYGGGAVTPDGKTIAPDPDVGIYEFTGAMAANPAFAPLVGPPLDLKSDGEPVDLSTGLFVMNKTDLALPDTLPIGITRTYRIFDGASRAFGIGATHQFDIFLVGDTTQYTYLDLILPHGGRVHFRRTSPGTGVVGARYVHDEAPGSFFHSKIYWTGSFWQLVMKDGLRMEFPDGLQATAPTQAAVRYIVDRFGNEIWLTRDSANLSRLTQIRSSDGARSIELTYDTSNRITQAKDNTGRTVGYQYNGVGQLWKVTDVAGGITEYTYDSQGQMKTIKDPRGIVYLTNYYDPFTGVKKQVLADGSVYEFAYTLQSGYVAQTDVTDPRGYGRRVTFNVGSSNPRAKQLWLTDTRALGRPEQQVTTVERNATTNLVTALIDPLGRRTEYGYNTVGDVTSITRLAGTGNAVTWNLSYDVTDGTFATTSDLRTITDPLQHTTTFNYNGARALTSIQDPLGHVTTITPAASGHTLSVMTFAGTTQFGYSGGLVSAATDGMGHTSSQTLDGAGRPVLLVDPLGNSTGINYNAFNQAVRIVDARGGATLLAYDPNGNLQTVTDARNGVTQYTYDSMDRLETTTDPLLKQSRYTYDLAGNPIEFSDRKGQITHYEYDGIRRLTKETFADGSSTTYTYDAGNRLMQVTDALTGTITFGYDGLDRLTSETNPRGSLTYTYDTANRRQTMTVAGQPTVIYGYDNADRLTSITQGSQVVTIGYDDANRRTSLTLPNSIVVAYGYNSASQLTSLTYTLGQTTLGNLTYTYDAAGRRTEMGGTWARTNLPGTVTSATYNAGNQLTTWNGTTLTYDFNGNLASQGTRTFDWDARNRMAAIGGVGTATFVYDGLGRRITRVVDGFTTDFLYDGVMTAQELVSGTPTANIVNGPAIDELLSRTESSGTRVLLADALGSTLALTDLTGAIKTQYTYEPFGTVTASGEPSGNATAFTGREADGTGLYYYRARFYEPGLHRFIAEDPIGFASWDFNVYSYVGNTPINSLDPLGLTPTSNWRFFWDWVLGRGPRQRPYTGDDQETREVADSPGGRKLRNQFYRGGCADVTDFDYGTIEAYWDTAVNPFSADWFDTSFQIGGFAHARAVNNGNGMVTFSVRNVAGTNSFFLHLPPNRRSPTGPMSNIVQNFQWTEPIGPTRGRKGCGG